MLFSKRLLLGLTAALLTNACASSTNGELVAPSGPQLSPSIPASIQAIMAKPRYANATWSLLVSDVESSASFYALNPTRLSYLGSTRKLFSVGMALNTLGADHRETTTVYRQGSVDSKGNLSGDLVLVAAGDLTFGGRRIDDNTIQFTNFDHNDANSLGSAILSPQDPLYGLDQLAAGVKASGITSISGEVAIDDRLFDPYRVPNGPLLITPIMVNENQVDVTISPTQPGQAASTVYRPQSQAFSVNSTVTTGAPDTNTTIAFSDNNLIESVPSVGAVQGQLAQDYVAPLTSINSYVRTFRIDVPSDYARTAFIEALVRQGITVEAAPVEPNPSAVLPAGYDAANQVAAYQSAPYAQHATLVLKVSLNLGANLSLSLFGLAKGQNTIAGALAAERRTLIQDFGLDGSQFSFPTNGSGSPDSQGSPQALVQILTAMAKTPVAAQYEAALPVLGVDGSLATTGTTLPGKGHVFAKTGTTVSLGADGATLELKAQNLAGYIETKGGRKVAYALLVNDAGPLHDFATDIGGVFQDEGEISSLIYESL